MPEEDENSTKSEEQNEEEKKKELIKGKLHLPRSRSNTVRN
jgi:hypothetical protein